MPALVTRSSNNFGPRQYPEKLIPLTIRRALAGEPIPIYGDGRNVRDWLYVEDNCRAIDAVLRQGIPGGVCICKHKSILSGKPEKQSRPLPNR